MSKDKDQRMFINPDQYDWKEISAEGWREYTFPGGHTYRIEGPKLLAVKYTAGRGDSHRIVCMDGTCHYVPSGWIGIKWTGRDGNPTYTL